MHRSAPPSGPVVAARRVGAAARLLAAPAGGLLLYASCAPRTLWWLAVPAFALLAVALRGRGNRAAFTAALLFGLGYYLPLLPWVGIYVGPVPWLALAGLQAVLVGLGGMLIARVQRLSLGMLWAAAGWVATEALAARVPFGGFPWGRVAFSQADGPFVRLAALGGPPLVGFAVALTGFALAELIQRALAAARTGPTPPAGPVPRWRPWMPPAAGAVLPLVVALLCPAWITGAGGEVGPDEGVTVAAVQGNVPRMGLDFNAQRRAVLDNHVRHTLELADDVAAGRAPEPLLVVWPENSSDIDPLRNPDAAAAISSATDRIGVPVMVGTVLVLDGRRTTNSVLVWEPGVGPVEQLDKRRVQPFGEYLPWRGFFRLFSDYADRAGYFEPGTGTGVASVDGVEVGVAICWEVAFDDLVAQSVDNGARLLAVPTNNATFGISEMTYQQLAMSRVRAVQHDRAVVVASTSGASAIIAPDGSEMRRSALFTPATLVERVPLRATTTMATRLGSLPEWLLVVAGVGALAWTLRRRPRREPAGGPGEPTATTREDNDG